MFKSATNLRFKTSITNWLPKIQTQNAHFPHVVFSCHLEKILRFLQHLGLHYIHCNVQFIKMSQYMDLKTINPSKEREENRPQTEQNLE